LMFQTYTSMHMPKQLFRSFILMLPFGSAWASTPWTPTKTT
jgi:glycopeptide antibiotics resistance protein